MMVRKVLVTVALLALLASAAGCGLAAAQRPAEPPAPPAAPPAAQPPAPEPRVVELYFAGPQADKVLPEVRELVAEGALAEAVVRALIQGPTTPGLSRTLPAETVLLGLEVKDKVAYVNFSKELRTKHWGGSAGDLMSIYSVVASLVALDEIDAVQFLVEGKKEEAIFGHSYTMEPITPDPAFIGR